MSSSARSIATSVSDIRRIQKQYAMRTSFFPSHNAAEVEVLMQGGGESRVMPVLSDSSTKEARAAAYRVVRHCLVDYKSTDMFRREGLDWFLVRFVSCLYLLPVVPTHPIYRFG